MANKPNKDLALRLRAAREQAGLSQGQVATLMNYQRPTISEIEAARRNVTTDELCIFADRYGVTTEWLLGREDATADLDPSLLLAARGLEKLKQEDLDRVIRFLKTLGGPQ